MKRICLSLALAALALPSLAATNVGVSVSVNQPGLYGRIDIGQVSAPPVLVYAKPVVVVPGPVAVVQRPIYLHVPPGHAKNWKKHCSHYAACGQPVYFVQEGWYQSHYAHKSKKSQKGHGKHKHHD